MQLFLGLGGLSALALALLIQYFKLKNNHTVEYLYLKLCACPYVFIKALLSKSCNAGVTYTFNHSKV